jgi:hypothetical protein
LQLYYTFPDYSYYIYISSDGFHTSASDPELQKKYGHTKNAYTGPPPPIFNNASNSQPHYGYQEGQGQGQQYPQTQQQYYNQPGQYQPPLPQQLQQHLPQHQQQQYQQQQPQQQLTQQQQQPESEKYITYI